MKSTFAIAALTAVFATSAFAQDGSDRSLASNLPLETYSYGMKLDVKKVISETDVSAKSGVVPVTMVYQDSQGNLHKVQFLQQGGYDDNANG